MKKKKKKKGGSNGNAKPNYLPSQEEIRCKCQEYQEEWSEQERKRRQVVKGGESCEVQVVSARGLRVVPPDPFMDASL